MLKAVQHTVSEGTVSEALNSLYAQYGITKSNFVDQKIVIDSNNQTTLYLTYDDDEQ